MFAWLISQYFFSQGTVFFSPNKSANITFSHALSGKRTGQRCMTLIPEESAPCLLNARSSRAVTPHVSVRGIQHDLLAATGGPSRSTSLYLLTERASIGLRRRRFELQNCAGASDRPEPLSSDLLSTTRPATRFFIPSSIGSHVWDYPLRSLTVTGHQ